MKIKDSPFASQCLKEIVYPFGTFYIFEKFVVGEMNEGIEFRWHMAKDIIKKTCAFFGTTNLKMSYISNRVNSYSVHPADWINFYKNKKTLSKVAFVSYSNLGYSNISLEGLFIKNNYKKFLSLKEAIDWISKSNS